MATSDSPYPGQFTVDYLDALLKRLYTLTRLLLITPIGIVLSQVSGHSWRAMAGGTLVVGPALMIFFGRDILDSSSIRTWPSLSSATWWPRTSCCCGTNTRQLMRSRRCIWIYPIRKLQSTSTAGCVVVDSHLRGHHRLVRHSVNLRLPQRDFCLCGGVTAWV